jgi:hypothetical protein
MARDKTKSKQSPKPPSPGREVQEVRAAGVARGYASGRNARERITGEVPPVRKYAALLVSDIHLSDKCPPFRKGEPSWMLAQGNYLEELKRISLSHGEIPIVCAGDVFDKWDASPELISLCLKYFPHMYSVCGQHDLRFHNYGEIKRTAYWTLVEAGLITHLHPGSPRPVSGLVLHGFPWGFEISPCEAPGPLEGFHLAVIHKYVWVRGCSYPDAPETSRLKKVRKSLKGFRVAHFGDNHLGFVRELEGLAVVNTGALIRRKSDQRNYRPRAALLKPCGGVDIHYLDTSQDKITEVRDVLKEVSHKVDLEDFLAELHSLERSPFDFREAVLQACQRLGVSQEVLEALIRAMET